MKKLILMFLIVAVSLIGCADGKKLCTYDNDHTKCEYFEPYGLFDSDVYKDKRVKYKVNVGNVIWSIILIESVFAPVLIVGYDIYEPVGWKLSEDGDCK